MVPNLPAVIRPLRWRALLTAVLVSLMFVLPAARAPAQVPTDDQLEIFQNLSPDQQSAVLEQLRQGNGSSDQGSSLNRDSDPDRRKQAINGRTDARSTLDRRRQIREETPRVPVLRPEDTVLVQVTLPERRLVTAARDDRVARGAVTTPNPGSSEPAATTGPNRSYLEPIELEAEERARLEKLVDLIRSRNPYRLDRNGALTLPGFAPIELGGLTEPLATQRLSADVALLQLDVKIVRLPLDRTGPARLEPFGYDLFEEASSTFAPLTDLPVAADYIVGPGDEVRIQLYGNRDRTLRLTVSRDGRINFPELGPISVAGMNFAAIQRSIEERVERELIGVRASVSLGEMRAIRVFALGEVQLPGSFSVSGQATITTALFASGGVKTIGSLRNIQLKRQGATVRTLDLYDLLIRGNNANDVQLQAGDVIFVPPIGPTVSVDGEVKRPAIYELRGEQSVAEVLALAGGLTPEADAKVSSITRIDASSRRVVQQVDLQGAGGERQVGNGDILRVARLRPQIDDGVTLDGFVYRPGPYAWRTGLRLSDVLPSVDELRPNADQQYVLIRRETGPDRRISVLSADLTQALAARGSAADVALQPRDQITVFDLGPGRDQVIKPVLDELRLQSELSRPTPVVRVEGRVKVPGEYPLEPGMTVRDLLRAGGNLQSSAFGGKAELARYTVSAEGSRRTELIEVDLEGIRRGDTNANVTLQPFDYLLIKETPDWRDQESVTLKGEVRFPGTYPIRRGETLSEVLYRAGGLTSLAFPKGSAFTRRELREREQKQIDQLANRMQSDIAQLSLQAAAANQGGASQALLAGQSLLGQLRDTKAVGRLVIDLDGLLAAKAGSAKDIALRDGDELIVPKQRQEVTVIGEVQSVTSHLYSRSLSRDDYIALSGGATRKADKGSIYVVRADGSVVARKGSLFTRSYDVAIQPGDTIVVPLDAERMPKLPFWLAVTQIIYNLAISVAAINSF